MDTEAARGGRGTQLGDRQGSRLGSRGPWLICVVGFFQAGGTWGAQSSGVTLLVTAMEKGEEGGGGGQVLRAT